MHIYVCSTVYIQYILYKMRNGSTFRCLSIKAGGWYDMLHQCLQRPRSTIKDAGKSLINKHISRQATLELWSTSRLKL